MLSPTSQPRHRQYNVRWQARLNAETHATLEALAKTFHRKRAAILRYVMQWGVAHTQRWTIDPSIPTRPHLLHMLVEPELLHQVQYAAGSYGVTVASWLRQAMRQVTLEDFPASWRTGATAVRSHDSRYYHCPFMLRLDAETAARLVTLTQALHRSATEVIRQLIAQATPEDFPESWHLAADVWKGECDEMG